MRETGTSTDPVAAVFAGELTDLRGELEAHFREHGRAVLDYRLSPVEVDGTVEGVVAVARDVTDRKRRERTLERRSRAMDAAPTGITITDPSREDNPLVYVNEHFEELTGYDRTEVLGRNCRFLQGEDTDPDQVTRLRRAIEAAEPCARSNSATTPPTALRSETA